MTGKRLKNSSITVRAAITEAGSGYMLSKILGISPQTVYWWLNKASGRYRRYVPERYAKKLSEAIGGR